MEYLNHRVWGAHTNMRSINPLLLVHLNSVYLYSSSTCSCHFCVQLGSTKVKLWHMQQKNFERLVTATKHVNYHLLDASSTLPFHFTSLFLNWGIFLHQNSSPTARFIPSGPAFWTKERSHVLIVSLALKVPVFWTHFILLLANGSSVKQLQGAKRLCLQVCAQYEMSTYSYSDGSVLKWTILQCSKTHPEESIAATGLKCDYQALKKKIPKDLTTMLLVGRVK